MPVTARYLPLVAFGVPVALGLVAGMGADRYAVSALLLLAEPLFGILLVYLLLDALWARRWAMAVALISGSTLAGWVVHLPTSPTALDEGPTPWADALRACAGALEPTRATIRVLEQSDAHPRGLEQAVDMLTTAHPDLVVLPRGGDGLLAAQVAAGIDGSARTVESAGIAVVVRGRFEVCRGTEDVWTMALGGPTGPQGVLAVLFPRIEGAGVLPLVVVRLAGPGRLADWSTWPVRIQSAGRAIAAVVDALGADRTLVVGDFAGPSTFRHLGAQLMGAGLTRIDLPPTWPVRWGPLPVPAMHQFDQLWAGGAWETAALPTLPTAIGRRRTVVADLSPRRLPNQARPTPARPLEDIPPGDIMEPFVP